MTKPKPRPVKQASSYPNSPPNSTPKILSVEEIDGRTGVRNREALYRQQCLLYEKEVVRLNALLTADYEALLRQLAALTTLDCRGFFIENAPPATDWFIEVKK